MSAKPVSHNRVLSASEKDLVGITQSPEVETLSAEELKSIGRRLKQAHSRAKDIGARQQREIRGKANPRGAAPATDNAGTVAKTQLLYQAVQQVDAEFARREMLREAKPSQASLSRHALELKIERKTGRHPAPGRSASQGMQLKKRQKPLKIGTTRKEVGRVSQAGKVAQARKDRVK